MAVSFRECDINDDATMSYHESSPIPFPKTQVGERNLFFSVPQAVG